MKTKNLNEVKMTAKRIHLKDFNSLKSISVDKDQVLLPMMGLAAVFFDFIKFKETEIDTFSANGFKNQAFFSAIVSESVHIHGLFSCIDQIIAKKQIKMKNIAFMEVLINGISEKDYLVKTPVNQISYLIWKFLVKLGTVYRSCFLNVKNDEIFGFSIGFRKMFSKNCDKIEELDKLDLEESQILNVNPILNEEEMRPSVLRLKPIEKMDKNEKNKSDISIVSLNVEKSFYDKKNDDHKIKEKNVMFEEITNKKNIQNQKNDRTNNCLKNKFEKEEKVFNNRESIENNRNFTSNSKIMLRNSIKKNEEFIKLSKKIQISEIVRGKSDFLEKIHKNESCKNDFVSNSLFLKPNETTKLHKKEEILQKCRILRNKSVQIDRQKPHLINPNNNSHKKSHSVNFSNIFRMKFNNLPVESSNLQSAVLPIIIENKPQIENEYKNLKKCSFLDQISGLQKNNSTNFQSTTINISKDLQKCAQKSTNRHSITKIKKNNNEFMSKSTANTKSFQEIALLSNNLNDKPCFNIEKSDKSLKLINKQYFSIKNVKSMIKNYISQKTASAIDLYQKRKQDIERTKLITETEKTTFLLRLKKSRILFDFEKEAKNEIRKIEMEKNADQLKIAEEFVFL